MGLQLDGVEISVRGLVNERGVYSFRGISPAMQEIRYEISVRSSEPPERIRAWPEAVEKSCPAYNTIRRPPPLVRRLVLNGTEVPVDS